MCHDFKYNTICMSIKIAALFTLCEQCGMHNSIAQQTSHMRRCTVVCIFHVYHLYHHDSVSGIDRHMGAILVSWPDPNFGSDTKHKIMILHQINKFKNCSLITSTLVVTSWAHVELSKCFELNPFEKEYVPLVCNFC